MANDAICPKCHVTVFCVSCNAGLCPNCGFEIMKEKDAGPAPSVCPVKRFAPAEKQMMKPSLIYAPPPRDDTYFDPRE